MENKDIENLIDNIDLDKIDSVGNNEAKVVIEAAKLKRTSLICHTILIILIIGLAVGMTYFTGRARWMFMLFLLILFS